MAARAIGEACGATPGPVHLNAAFREPLWAPGVGYGPPSQEPLLVHGNVAVPVLDPARQRIARAKRGVIVCGPRSAGANLSADAGFAAAVQKLAARLGWPVLADAISGARRDGTITTYDALLRSSTFADAMRPDLVLRFGQLPASKPLAAWLNNGVPTTILVEPSGALHDPASVADLLVSCDPTALCDELAKTAERAGDGWLGQWQRAENTARRVLAEAAFDGFWEGAIAASVGRALPANALLHVASSMPVRDLESFATQVPAVTANRGANGIDGTIATACGAALAWDGPTVALLGDLAFVHDIGSLATARALNANLTLVVVDNHGGGIFDFLPIAAHEPRAFARYFSTPQEVDIAATAAAFGFATIKVGSLPELEQALAGAGQGSRLIHAAVDRSRNVTRHRASATAVARALEAIL
jgi:2-succinyl-5-enolpyruvyl-6-hydroxy-3-cyclohexene-1-carboxylate synthase